MDDLGVSEQTHVDTDLKKKRKISGGSVILILVTALFLLVILGINGFSRYLNEQLFIERQTHLLEITDKVSEIIDIVIESTWGRVKTCEQLLVDEGDVSQPQLLDNLDDMSRYVKYKNSIFLAFDQTASYYSSDGHIGHWLDPSVFVSSTPDEQVIVAGLPYLSANDTYMVFIKRLDNYISVKGTDREITHIAMALEIASLKNVFAVSGFDDNCYTFIVNSEGRRLYKNTNLQRFIDGYNIITAMEKVEFINGGDIEELRSAVGNEKKACLEFEYNDRNYYVGTSLVPSVNWEVMLFVPTDVLGANSDVLLNRTSQYFIGIGIVALILCCIAVFTIMISYSDRKLMRQQKASNALLAKAAEEAECANRAKSDFLSRMSHDIRTPINGIMGMTNIAEKNIENKERAIDCLRKIDTASRHLLSLVNDVLDMSSIESGKATLGAEPVNINDVISNCVSIISGQLIDRELKFINQIEKFEHPNVLGDELRLGQIFINILGNAVKFTPDGGTITFSAQEYGTKGNNANFRFVIEDSGIGMSEEFMEHIFEPFSQADSLNRSTYSGTGLGMAITKQFVDLMGGSIRAQSIINHGSKFTVELPLEIDKGVETADLSQLGAADISGIKILLVEDNDLNMEIACCLLEEEKASVTCAKNGKEAVDIFAGSPPGTFDLILMDVMMPVMDGMTAAREIRALQREDAAEIPIIAMTANAYEEDRKKTREAGMNEHLSKPIDGKLLLKTLSGFYRKDADA